MNAKMGTIIAAVAGVVACAAGWLALPALQGAQLAVERDAAVSLERARRLLHQYNASLTYKSMLSDWLEAEVTEFAPDELTSELEDDYQQLHAAMWEAYTPTDWPRQGDAPRMARANYGNVPGQIRDGLGASGDIVARNDQLLEQAMSAVEEALSVSAGNESSRSYAEANRLKAAILHHMGLTSRVEAQLYRRESDGHRRALAAMAIDAEAARATTQDAAADATGRISELTAKATNLASAIDADTLALADLDARIRDLQTRLDAGKSRRNDALEAMRALKAEGIDFADPDAGERFQIRLTAFDKAFRDAAREVHALESGDMPNAMVDPTADFLTGPYVENGSSSNLTVKHGLSHYHDQRSVLADELVGKERALADLRSDLARLEGIRAAQANTLTRATAKVAELTESAAEVYAELNRVESEAFAIEDEALDLLDQAARTAQQAANYAQRWIRDARDRTQGLSPETRSRSAFDGRLRDGWMGGYIAAEEADARLARAWIYFDRFDAARQNSAMLEAMGEALQIKEADLDSEREKMNEAHDAGLVEVTSAMEVLEQAHRGSERHWTVSAQAAGATYLLALFGHNNYVADTIEAYRNAVKGRESEKYAETFVSRLSRLEQR